MGWYQSRNRNGYGKRTAMSSARTFSKHTSAMCLHKFTYNRQTQAKSSMRPSFRALTLPKAIKDMWKQIGIYTAAVISNLNLCIGCDARESNLDMAATRRELDRIRQKIRENLLQPGSVPYDYNFWLRRDLQVYAVTI